MMFANQKRITVQKEVCDNQNLYTVINIDSLREAMINLNRGSSLKLWIYLAKNQNGYQFDLSAVDCAEWGMKVDSYHSAVKDLKKKGYLQETKPNHFIFRERITEKENPYTLSAKTI